jgi:hypothetical protein
VDTSAARLRAVEAVIRQLADNEAAIRWYAMGTASDTECTIVRAELAEIRAWLDRRAARIREDRGEA